MILPLLLAAAAPQATALDAERAFDAAAASEGQWTAFRKFAAPDATMFVPDAVNAQQWLKDRKDPATSVRWQPAVSFVSCSGTTAANTGSWQRPDGTVGYFTTVWRRDADGVWRWVLDRGDALFAARPVPTKPDTHAASCDGNPRALGFRVKGMIGGGAAHDFSLLWYWKPEKGGIQRFGLLVWNGKSYDQMITDDIGPNR